MFRSKRIHWVDMVGGVVAGLSAGHIRFANVPGY